MRLRCNLITRGKGSLILTKWLYSGYLVDGLCEVCTKSVEWLLIYHFFCSLQIQSMVDHFVNREFALNLRCCHLIHECFDIYFGIFNKQCETEEWWS